MLIAGVVLLICSFGLLGWGVPVPIAMGLGGLTSLAVFRSGAGLSMIPLVVWSTASNFILTAIPTFVFMGEVILKSGASNKFYRGLTQLLRRTPGGVAMSNIGACGIFAAVSGSSVVTLAAIGNVAYPENIKAGVPKRLAIGSLAGGGTLGILIPPSAALIIYGSVTGESVPQLFMAGLLPGILAILLFLPYVGFAASRGSKDLRGQNNVQPRDDGGSSGRWDWIYVLPLAVIIVLVLGGIWGGFVTPTEAGAIGLLGAFILARLMGTNWGVSFIQESATSALITTSRLLFIIIGAQFASFAFSYTGLGRALCSTVIGWDMNPWVLLIVIYIIYVVTGCVLESISLIVVTIPLFYPIIIELGFDPIWFGVAVVLLVEIGLLTPPVGLNLFVAKDVVHDLPFADIIWGCIPFVILLAVVLIIITVFPEIALFLPSSMTAR